MWQYYGANDIISTPAIACVFACKWAKKWPHFRVDVEIWFRIKKIELLFELEFAVKAISWKGDMSDWFGSVIINGRCIFTKIRNKFHRKGFASFCLEKSILHKKVNLYNYVVISKIFTKILFKKVKKNYAQNAFY